MKSLKSLLTLLCLGLVFAPLLAGCGQSTKSAEDEKKAFTSPPDYNKLTSDQKKMVDSFRHGPSPSGKKAAH